MPPILTRPPAQRGVLPAKGAAPARPARPAVPRTAPAVRGPLPIRRGVVTASPRRRAIAMTAAMPRLSVPAAPSPLAGWQGPNPYGEFARTFTDAGGIRLTFRIQDPQLWRTVIRAILWLLVMAATLWFMLRASPYPPIPRGCGVTRACPDGLVALHLLVNVVAFGVMAGLCWWILFFADQTLTTIEIRPDCMIVDDADVFWRDRMDLGWPRIVPAGDGSFVLRGVYGTREIDYVTLHPFDEKDRAIQVLGAHLQFAMQQLWQRPAG